MLSFEGEQYQGMQPIMTKLTTLNFQTVQHIAKTVDCHPGINGSIVVFVTGNLAVRAHILPAPPPHQHAARQGCRTAGRHFRACAFASCHAQLRSRWAADGAQVRSSLHARARGAARALAQVDGSVTTPLMFSQTFTLVPTADKTNWWILNDIFRLNYS